MVCAKSQKWFCMKVALGESNVHYAKTAGFVLQNQNTVPMENCVAALYLTDMNPKAFISHVQCTGDKLKSPYQLGSPSHYT